MTNIYTYLPDKKHRGWVGISQSITDPETYFVDYESSDPNFRTGRASVWTSGHPRCTGCSTLQNAMARSCWHAKAVAKFMLKIK